jgi:hypothetical protein
MPDVSAEWPRGTPGKPSSLSLVDRIRQRRTDGMNHCKEIHEEATKLQKFANGHQWPDTKGAPEDAGRRVPKLSVNEIGPILQTFSGREMMQRFSRVYLPRPGMDSSARWAEIMTNVDAAMMDACDDEQLESATFKDGPGIQGVAWQRWFLNTLETEDGKAKLDKKPIPIWSMLWDPNAKEVNLKDRTWHCLGEWWDRAEVEDRWPVAARKGLAGQGWLAGANEKSSRIPWMGMEGNKKLEVYDPRDDSLFIEYWEWREIGNVWTVTVPNDPSSAWEDAIAQGAPGVTQVEMDRDKLTAFRGDYKKRLGVLLPIEATTRHPKVQYRFAYVCGDEILETDELQGDDGSPLGCFTFQALTGFRFPLPEKTTFTSLVSRMIDLQRWMNVLISALIRNIQINPKGVLFVEEGVFKHKGEALNQFSSPGGVITVRKGAISGGQKPFEFVAGGTQSYVTMVESLLQYYQSALPRIAGFNPSALGQIDDPRRVATQVVRGLQDAAMAANAEPFDALRHHRREGGRIFTRLLYAYFEPEDLAEYIGEELAWRTVQEGQQIPGPDGQPLAVGAKVIGPDGQPVSAIPPKSAWLNCWKSISVEEVTPSGDALQALWDSIMQAGGGPEFFTMIHPDTGKPLFSAVDQVKMIPRLPTALREEMLTRVKLQTQQAQAQAQQPPQPPPPQVSMSLKDIMAFSTQAAIEALAQRNITVQPQEVTPQPPPAQPPAAPAAPAQ